ncbi:MAG: hypothetical protein ABI120_00765 [Gemmatimonadaceae bacterium]
MTDTTAISLSIAAVVGAGSGADASIWGMYKDAAHEGFRWRVFFRSIVLGCVAAVTIQACLNLDLHHPRLILLLFGLAYATERVVVEIWKTFIRDEDQSKYTIPMQFSVRGLPVKNRALRYAACAGYVALIAVAVLVAAQFTANAQTLAAAGVAGFIAGIVIACGGAWKDAPIEGFEGLKFFRSPALTTLFALALFMASGSVVLAAIAAIGYERATSENYKTFFFPSRPRGKFAGKPVTHPQMLRQRSHFVPAYVVIRLALLSLVVGTQ